MAEFREEIIATIIKAFSAVWTWLCLILLGVMGMIGNNLFLGRKMTFWQAVGSIFMAVFVGSVTSVICYLNGWDKVGAFLVPVMTLVAEKVMIAVMAFDWTKNIKEILREQVRTFLNRFK